MPLFPCPAIKVFLFRASAIPYPGKPPQEYYRTLLPYGIGKYHKSKEGGRKCLGHGYGCGYGFRKTVTLAQNRAVGVIKEPVIEQKW